jgi:hypothetical protein
MTAVTNRLGSLIFKLLVIRNDERRKYGGTYQPAKGISDDAKY